MGKKVIHIISHSHWDREWYMPFEKHRLKLVQLVDECIELFDQKEGFESFHLDGQTIVLDDYLEVKPENFELLKRKVVEDRFHVGPWYILQDEFLVSGEASVRNLLVGIEEAVKYGKVCKIGYFPDAFGNAGQMPQLLKQAGMEAVIFGRGVKPVGFNNTIVETGEYESQYSEMIWNSPDGSGLLGILFANWYNNGAEIPVEEKEAKIFWDQKLQDALRYASTKHLLFMNGCDHQPVQKDITRAIEVANRLYPDYEFLHSNFNEYIKCVKKAQVNKLSIVTGELTSQSTDGWTTLVNTASSRIYLKQLNRENEAALTNLAEPFAAMASVNGAEYPHAALKYAWKTLMQNHPHDSICGCSVDEVHEEMILRHKKSLQVSEELIKASMLTIGSHIDTSGFDAREAYPFVVYNTSGWERSGVISIRIDISRNYRDNLPVAYDKMMKITLKPFVLLDPKGNQISCKIKDVGVGFGYDLPEDKFRQPFMARQVEVTFQAEKVPAMGYKVYSLVTEEVMNPIRQTQAEAKSLVIQDGMENRYLKVTINKNGTINLLHKETGKLYPEICYYEDTGDIGNEYIYRQPEGDHPILSKDTSCSYQLIEDEEYRATYQITQSFKIPESADEVLEEERNSMTDFRHRKAKRSRKHLTLTITTYITLECEERAITVRSEFENRMKDHRLRMIIPTDIKAENHFADSVFEIVKRPNHHANTWINPSGCEHQQCFCGIADDEFGMVVANVGLYEYEILQKENCAIAVTLLRAVGEMGDWGVFPTPEAQCLRKGSVSIKLIPFAPSSETHDPVTEAYQFQYPMKAAQIPVQKGSLPMEKSYLKWQGRGIYLTSMKNKNNSGFRMIRWMNGTGQERSLTITCCDNMKRVYRSNVIEEELEELIADRNGSIHVLLRPYEIFTVGFEV